MPKKYYLFFSFFFLLTPVINNESCFKEGLTIDSEGFVSIDSILKHSNIKGKFSLHDIKEVVKTSYRYSKPRFTLKERGTNALFASLYIKANWTPQDKEDEDDKKVLIFIKCFNQFFIVVHLLMFSYEIY